MQGEMSPECYKNWRKANVYTQKDNDVAFAPENS